MEEVKVLMSILRKKDENEPLSSSEQQKLNDFYRQYIKDNYDSRKIISYQDISDVELFNYVSSRIEKKKYLEEINIFRTLLENKGKTVKLSDLYKSVNNNLSEEEIVKNIKNPELMRIFFEKLNGCILEETVSSIDMSNFNISNLGSINAEIGTDIDPVLFVKSLTPISMPEIDINQNGNDNVTILTIPDLHLDEGCYIADEAGNLVIDQEKFEERLLAFVTFRDDLIRSLKSEGIKITGIVYTGDILDTFIKDNNKGVVSRATIDNLVEAFIKFDKKGNHQEFLKSIPTSLEDDEGYFVAYLAGNHDIRIGREAFNKIMRMFGNFYGDNLVDLGNGSARIKIGDEFVSFMHHNSLDWGLIGKEDMVIRNKKHEATYHFDEYFNICDTYFKTKEFQEKLKSATEENPNIDPVRFLMTLVNEKLKKENPKLYYVFLPYIIPNTEKEGQFIKKDEIKNGNTYMYVQRNIPFFRNFLELETKKGKPCLKQRTRKEDGIEKKTYPTVEHFKSFITENDSMSFPKLAPGEKAGLYIKRLIDSTKEIAEDLGRIGYNVIPQFGRSDNYTPILYSLSHFHSKLKFLANAIGENVKDYSAQELPFVYLEGHSQKNEKPKINYSDYEEYYGVKLFGKSSLFALYIGYCNKLWHEDEEFQRNLKKAKHKNPNLDEVSFLMEATNQFINEETTKIINEVKNGERYISTATNLKKRILLYRGIEAFAEPDLEKYLQAKKEELAKEGYQPESTEYQESLNAYKKMMIDDVPYFKKYIKINGDIVEGIDPPKSVLNPTVDKVNLKEIKFNAGLISINTSKGVISKISIKELLTNVVLTKINQYYSVVSTVTEGKETTTGEISRRNR